MPPVVYPDGACRRAVAGNYASTRQGRVGVMVVGRNRGGPIVGLPAKTAVLRHGGMGSLDAALGADKVSRYHAFLWAAGAVTGLLALLLPHGHHVEVVPWIVMSVGAAVMAVIVFSLGSARNIWVHYPQTLAALVIVTIAIRAAHGSPTVYAVAFLYLLIAVYSASFYPTAALVVILALQAGASALVMIKSGESGGPSAWAVANCVTIAVAAVVHGLRRELTRSAWTDPLTGLWNRRSLEPLLEAEISNCARHGRSISVAVIDLDRFKQINDVEGHQAGDSVLKQVARAWLGQIRAEDLLVRIGGDEFVLVLPDTDALHACALIERLRRGTVHSFSAGVATTDFSHQGNVIGAGRVSVDRTGAENARQNDTPRTTEAAQSEDMRRQVMAELLQAADGACYRAKQAGRGGVVVAPLVALAG